MTDRSELIDAIEDLMAQHPGLDWTCAAQSVAMAKGLNEREVLDKVRSFYG